MLTRLDIHIAKQYLVRYLLALAAVIGLYVIVDAIERLPAISRQPTASEIVHAGASYYLSHAPLFLLDFAGAINLIAGILTLSDLLYRNEFTAMRTSGISSRRALLSLVVVTLVPGFVIWRGQEEFGPSLVPHYRYARKAVRCKDHLASIHNIVVSDNYSQTFLINTYSPQDEWLKGICILPEGDGSARVYAPRGKFTSGGVVLYQATKWEIDSDTQVQKESQELFIATNLCHEILMRRWIEPPFLRASHLRKLAKQLEGWPAEVRGLRTEYHRRFADLLEGFGLLLASIPVVVWWYTSVQGMGMAWWLVKLIERLLPLLIFAAFYSIKIGLGACLSPVLAVWLPVGLLCAGGVTAYCLSRF